MWGETRECSLSYFDKCIHKNTHILWILRETQKIPTFDFKRGHKNVPHPRGIFTRGTQKDIPRWIFTVGGHKKMSPRGILTGGTQKDVPPVEFLPGGHKIMSPPWDFYGGGTPKDVPPVGF